MRAKGHHPAPRGPTPARPHGQQVPDGTLAPTLALLARGEDGKAMQRSIPAKIRRASGRPAVSFLPQTDLALRDPSLPTPTLDRTARDRIGRELRAMYVDLARQPVPQRLLDLLGKLEETKG